MITNYAPYTGSEESYLNTISENGDAVNDTINLFSPIEPYYIKYNVYGIKTITFYDSFINKVNESITTGEYSSSFSSKEKELFKLYIEYKFGTGITEPDDVIISLDTRLGL